MDGHDDLSKYSKGDEDFPSNPFDREVGRDGLVRIGFTCPYCGEYYVASQSSGSRDDASELPAMRIKRNQHAASCSKYQDLLAERKRLDTDPEYAREMDIKYFVERGWEDKIPPEWKDDVEKFWKKYKLKDD